MRRRRPCSRWYRAGRARLVTWLCVALPCFLGCAVESVEGEGEGGGFRGGEEGFGRPLAACAGVHRSRLGGNGGATKKTISRTRAMPKERALKFRRKSPSAIWFCAKYQWVKIQEIQYFAVREGEHLASKYLSSLSLRPSQSPPQNFVRTSSRRIPHKYACCDLSF